MHHQKLKERQHMQAYTVHYISDGGFGELRSVNHCEERGARHILYGDTNYSYCDSRPSYYSYVIIHTVRVGPVIIQVGQACFVYEYDESMAVRALTHAWHGMHPHRERTPRPAH